MSAGALTEPMTEWALRVGVHPPEKCVVPDDLFPELERRGCCFEVSVS